MVGESVAFVVLFHGVEVITEEKGERKPETSQECLTENDTEG